MSRSGTTLLCTVLDSHPDISMGYELMPPGGLPELAALVECIERVSGEARPGKALREQGDVSAAKFVRFAQRARVEAPRLATVLRGLAEDGVTDISHLPGRAAVARALITEKMRLEGTCIGGFKNNSSDSTPFVEWFPGARFVFIVRDPRDVVASHLKRGFPKDVPDVSVAWKSYVTKFASFRSRYGELAMFMRYEDLVRNPQDAVGQLADHVGVDGIDGMLRFFDSKASIHGMGHVENDRLGRGFDTSSIGRWRTELAEEQVAVVERSTAKLMDRFKYPRG